MLKTKKVEWDRFGLKSDEVAEEPSESTQLKEHVISESCYGVHEAELFAEEKGDKPWWLSQFFIREQMLFGAWDGVFTSCLLNLLGVIIFLRSGWVVGEAGIIMAGVVVLISVLIVSTSVLSAAAICDRTRFEGGGVYILISHVLGAKVGASVGLIYCFGQAVSVALCVSGFGESMSDLMHLPGLWAEKAVGAAAILLLALVNAAGVKWVVKVQLLLLTVVVVGAMDFVVGSAMEHEEENGVTGFSWITWRENLAPKYGSDVTWFTVLGIFFPAVTGITVGINMKGDLRNPQRDIPVGTFSALAVGTVFYMTFIIFLGATVQRFVLVTDNMITEQLSATGFLLLTGLYTSTLASSLSSLYGTPRVLRSIAEDRSVPCLQFLQTFEGARKVPLLSLFITVVVTIAFLLFGNINSLAPIVTMPFLLAYAAIDYAYFALAMTADLQMARDTRLRDHALGTPSFETLPDDLDHLFPDRRMTNKKVMTSAVSSGSTSGASTPHEGNQSDSDSDDSGKPRTPNVVTPLDAEHLPVSSYQIPGTIEPKSHQTCYSNVCNRWVALFGMALKLTLMICVHWVYGLVIIVIFLTTYLYVCRAAPGSSPGLAWEFSFWCWLKNCFLTCIGRGKEDYGQLIVPPQHPGVQISAAALTKENQDFSQRTKFHQTLTENSLPGTY